MGDAAHRALARRVYADLRQLVRERAASRPGGHLLESRLEQFTFELCLPLTHDATAPRQFADRLVRSLDEILDGEVERAAAFRPGRLYCHRCGSADCEHAQPPSCRHVFVGYAATGHPRWEDFAQVCLALKHPQVDRLYVDPPVLLTLVRNRDELQGAMLAAFRNGTHELQGQLTAGFYSVPTRAEEGRGVLALTIQVVSTQTRRGALHLGLNLLGRSPTGESLERLWERQRELPWRRSLRWAQAAVETISVRPSRRRGGLLASDDALRGRVLGILNALARRLVRDQRARSRRTRHAELRHASGERPTRKALDDARAAGDEALWFDEHRDTVVVLGDRGRTHFFTADGQLVSSVRYSPEAIEHKLRIERWIKIPEEVSSTFRAKLPF